MNGNDRQAEERRVRRLRQSEFRHRLGERVKQMRQERGMSQERLALDAGITQFQVSEIEAGKRNPSATTLWAISGAFETTLAGLLDGVD